uniref:Segment polarity protein dishevelled-like protein DVL-3 n=1 Tax=Enterobius vermicularis TaxID=51028 RepID=A0A0N4VLP3_ENTVE
LIKFQVYYYLDDSTPYLSVIPVPDDKITLGDFKKVFGKKGYKFFCKQLDKAIGCEVKVELRDNSTKLEKSSNGLIELVLLSSSNGSHISGTSTLPRAASKKGKNGHNKHQVHSHAHNDGFLRKKRSLHELSAASDSTDGHINTASKSNENSIKANSSATVISKRAGEGLAEMYTSNSEDPYKFDDMNSRFSFQSGPDSSTYAGVPMMNPTGLPCGKVCRQRRPRKERYRKAYVPSTISSVTESSRTSLSLPRIVIISLSMKDAPYLGISVVGHDGGIFVSSISKGGAVAKDGRIEIGDQIIQVNRTSFENLTEKQAVQLLKQVAVSRRPVTLYVAKRPCSIDSRSDILAGLASETLPIDISLWVESTKRQCMSQFINDKTSTSVTNSVTIDGDGVMEGAYAEGRDVFGTVKPGTKGNMEAAKLCSAEDIARRKENEENEQLVKCLSWDMDPSVILKHMARPDSGLQIKNRKWLKIPVPMSFIGRDLVDWLLDNVHGIRDRKAARSFASQLLTQGYIKHVVNKLTFTEKCYYVFDEAILSVRNTNHSNSSNGKAGTESTTEVTYVASPAPPLPPRVGLRNFNNGNRKLPGNADETWPLSPITNVCDPSRRKSGCESPLVSTNDYASVIGPEVITSTMLAGTTNEVSSLNLSRRDFGHCANNRRRVVDEILVSQPPNTPSSLSLAQNNAVSAASETEFEVMDEERRVVNSNGRC